MALQLQLRSHSGFSSVSVATFVVVVASGADKFVVPIAVNSCWLPSSVDTSVITNIHAARRCCSGTMVAIQMLSYYFEQVPASANLTPNKCIVIRCVTLILVFTLVSNIFGVPIDLSRYPQARTCCKI